jgi:hypothetical protein
MNCGKGGSEVFFESGNGLFGGVDPMVVQRDKLDVD